MGNGGGIDWGSANGIIIDSNFNGNTAQKNGGAFHCWANNCTLIGSTFIGNTAKGNGGAVAWDFLGSMINCNFINSKWDKSNGIYIINNLNITGGNGIVDIVTNTNSILSGTSIVVLNNETYYYPPNSNINLTNKNMHKLKT